MTKTIGKDASVSPEDPVSHEVVSSQVNPGTG